MVSEAPRLLEDPTVYPVEERVGEDILQRWIVEMLRPLMERWLKEQGRSWFVGADQFIYYEQFNPVKRAAPDVYVLPGVAPNAEVSSWKIWETGVVPSFVLEVVSKEWRKDYADAPRIYNEMGVTELVVFDPHYQTRREGVRFQRYYRSPTGGLELVETGNEKRISCAALSLPGRSCELVCQGDGYSQRLRLARGDGSLFPTFEEEKEAERQAKEAERREKEAERREKEAALARIAELEAKLKGKF